MKYTLQELMDMKGTSEPVRSALQAMSDEIEALRQDAERKPLTDEQIDELINEHYGENAFAHDLIRRVVRAAIRESSRPNAH